MCNLDVRCITFSKWLIPKTSSLRNIGTYAVSASHFDLFEVEKVEYKQGEQPLEIAYKKMYEKRESGYANCKDSHIKHSILLFSQCDSSERKHIESFWTDMENENSEDSVSDMLYICMLKLAKYPEERNSIDQWIDRAFKHAINNDDYRKHYVWYYSFDFSDIVIICKNINIDTYIKALFTLNYYDYRTAYDASSKNIGISCESKRSIRDTITIYGFLHKKLMQKFDQFHSQDVDSLNKKIKFSSGEFNLQVQIGVQDLTEYRKFKSELVQILEKGEIPDLTLGRFDVSLVAKKKSELWVEYFLYILEKYTTDDYSEPLDGNKQAIYNDGLNKVFCKYQITIGIEDKVIDEIEDSDFAIAGLNQDLSLYTSANKVSKGSLSALCEKYTQRIKDVENIKDYYMSASEIYISILAILKTGFSDEFVLCIYHSFYRYLEYVIYNLDLNDPNKHDEFYDIQRHFFSNLSALINCTIHSDREFIQIPSFNASLYTVPPKLLALYTSIADRIETVLNDSGKGDEKKTQTYTFMFTPSFKKAIEVVSITGNSDPNNRILTVRANEAVLYDPKSVIYTMAHEIAHYVGDKTRRRDVRRKSILCSITSYLMRYFECNIINTDLCSEVRCALILGIYEAIDAVISVDINYKDFYEKSYMVQLHEFLIQTHWLTNLLTSKSFKDIVIGKWNEKLSESIVNSSTAKEFICDCAQAMDNFSGSKYLNGLLENNTKECIQIIARYIYSKFCTGIDEVRLYDNKNYTNYCEDVCSLFSETYSDVSMNLILGISGCTDYTKMFEKLIVFDEIPYVYNVRKAVVAKVVFSKEELYQNLFVTEHESEPPKPEDELQHNKRILWGYVFDQLYEYLSECKNELQDHFSNKEDELNSIRDIVKTLTDFNNFDLAICKLWEELDLYRKKLCGLY